MSAGRPDEGPREVTDAMAKAVYEALYDREMLTPVHRWDDTIEGSRSAMRAALGAVAAPLPADERA